MEPSNLSGPSAPPSLGPEGGGNDQAKNILARTFFNLLNKIIDQAKENGK